MNQIEPVLKILESYKCVLSSKSIFNRAEELLKHVYEGVKSRKELVWIVPQIGVSHNVHIGHFFVYTMGLLVDSYKSNDKVFLKTLMKI